MFSINVRSSARKMIIEVEISIFLEMLTEGCFSKCHQGLRLPHATTRSEDQHDVVFETLDPPSAQRFDLKSGICMPHCIGSESSGQLGA